MIRTFQSTKQILVLGSNLNAGLQLTEGDKSIKKESVSIRAQTYRAAYKKMEAGHHDQIRRLLAETVVFASELSANPQQFAEFVELPFFAGRKKGLTVKNVLRLVFCFVMDATDGPKYERACNYAVALGGMMSQTDVEEADVTAAIEKVGGIENLYRDAVEERKCSKFGLDLLHIETGEPDLLLALDASEGEEFQIVIRRESDGPGGWKRFVLVEM